MFKPQNVSAPLIDTNIKMKTTGWMLYTELTKHTCVCHVGWDAINSSM